MCPPKQFPSGDLGHGPGKARIEQRRRLGRRWESCLRLGIFGKFCVSSLRAKSGEHYSGDDMALLLPSRRHDSLHAKIAASPPRASPRASLPASLTRRSLSTAVSALLRLVAPLLVIEREVHALLARLFADVESFPVILLIDAWPPVRMKLPPIRGTSIDRSHGYSECENGHTLDRLETTTIYTCFAYVTEVEMQASCTIIDNRVTSIQTNTFDVHEGIRTSTAGSSTFVKDLSRLRNLLREAVVQRCGGE